MKIHPYCLNIAIESRANRNCYEPFGDGPVSISKSSKKRKIQTLKLSKDGPTSKCSKKAVSSISRLEKPMKLIRDAKQYYKKKKGIGHESESESESELDEDRLTETSETSEDQLEEEEHSRMVKEKNTKFKKKGKHCFKQFYLSYLMLILFIYRTFLRP